MASEDLPVILAASAQKGTPQYATQLAGAIIGAGLAIGGGAIGAGIGSPRPRAGCSRSCS
jgi:hypothetical protein